FLFQRATRRSSGSRVPGRYRWECADSSRRSRRRHCASAARIRYLQTNPRTCRDSRNGVDLRLSIGQVEASFEGRWPRNNRPAQTQCKRAAGIEASLSRKSELQPNDARTQSGNRPSRLRVFALKTQNSALTTRLRTYRSRRTAFG